LMGACVALCLFLQATRRLTNRWSGRVNDKVPASNASARAAQLNR
jgi:hypothetical protein